MSKIRRPVERLTAISGQVLERYDSITLAAIACYADGGSISKACRGKLQVVAGYKWRYCDES